MTHESDVFFLGLDIGSVSLNCVLTNSTGTIIYSYYESTGGKPVEKIRDVIEELLQKFGNIRITGCIVCGSGKDLIAGLLQVGKANEIIAHAKAAWTVHPAVHSVIEIGGQDSKYSIIDRHRSGKHFLKDHKFNQLCAAGTGAFIDQQAERMGLTTERLGILATKTEKAANVAGRCSVFAKSDMIHLQQKAVPVEEIASGLCFALARNFLSTMCKGRFPKTPVLFQGGVAANKGVIQAFQKLLDFGEDELIIPENFKVMGAWGSALIADERRLKRELALNELLDRLGTARNDQAASVLAPIDRQSEFAVSTLKNKKTRSLQKPFFLGVDIGSASTKCVIIDSQTTILAAVYGPTAGQPINSLRKRIRELTDNVLDEVSIAQLAATGSGRHLATTLLGGGTPLDEISAQAAACSHFFPSADTIIEIGGQDSKFIRLKEGRITSFKMNKACAAGTGAFLEEQAGRLNINIKEEFSEKAFASKIPVKLGSKCTVFMDSDLVHHLQRGAVTEDLCAGLSYSVAENYLEKVVGAENCGSAIVFQGGVAKNEAVHAVFQQLLKQPVKAHPLSGVSGAFGAALAARKEYKRSNKDLGIQLGAINIQAHVRSFDCASCENFCDIWKITTIGDNTAYFGGLCGKYETTSRAESSTVNPFIERDQLLWNCIRKSEAKPSRGPIGIPFALTLHDHLPFWATFFNTLGYEVIYSGNTNRSQVEKGVLYGPGGFCYPMKVLFGHVCDLKDKGICTLFIPHLRMFKPPQEEETRYACPYTQAASYLVRETIVAKSDILTLEYPVENELAYWIEETAERLNITSDSIKTAVQEAHEAQAEFVECCRDAGSNLLKNMKKRGERGAVLLGRPYNTSDRFINLHLATKLLSLGIVPLPPDFIPPESDPLPELWSRVRWGYGRKLLQSARALKSYRFIGAIVVTNFGCGPDGFVNQYLEHELRDIPHIVLEFDEHQAEAGLLTRLEAFNRNFRIRTEKVSRVEGVDPGKPRIPLREYTYYVPSFMDHAYAITGALKASGCNTVLLPPTDDESWNLGMKHSYGKECHPFVSFTGDLLKAAAKPGFVPERACYYAPSYLGPCLLPQYSLALHLILEKAGLGDITVMNIADENNMKELGPSYMLRLALGLYTIDRFFRWKTEIEPYSSENGAMESTYKQILLDLEDGLATGNYFRFIQEIRRGVKKISRMKLKRNEKKRPGIGVVGDIYTRVNCHSNNHLYKKLQDAGFEVWASSTFIDVSILALEQLPVEYRRTGHRVKSQLARLALPGIKLAKLLVDCHFPAKMNVPKDRDYRAITRTTDRYVGFWIDKALSLNINRIEELHKAGASGVLNVMCHNCMLGTITDSLTDSLGRDMADMPISTLVYEGLQPTHNINRIEAFVDQVLSRQVKN